jgi:hypothetical protein
MRNALIGRIICAGGHRDLEGPPGVQLQAGAGYAMLANWTF